MTTATFNALLRFRTAALAQVKREHCQPPAYKPAQDVHGAIECPKCRGLLTFNVRASDGRSNGRCASAGCVTWNE